MEATASRRCPSVPSRTATAVVVGLGILFTAPVSGEKATDRAGSAEPAIGAISLDLSRGGVAQAPAATLEAPALEAARADPKLMGDHIRDALLDWLEALCDIGPTMLFLLGLPQPEEMTGRPLLELEGGAA